MSEVVQIPVLGSRRAWALILAPVGGAFLVESDSAEADRHAEALWQLREGGEYEYEFPDSHLYFAKHDCVSPSVGHLYRGRIRTGNLVGRLKLDVVLDYTCEIVGHVEFEVTSWKLDYREDYQRMLGDIARRATDLVFSPRNWFSSRSPWTALWIRPLGISGLPFCGRSWKATVSRMRWRRFVPLRFDDW